jgi:Chaperone of endosialidase
MLAVLLSTAESRATVVASGHMPPPASDIRLKRDIAQVGELDSGINLYRYRYLWSDTTYVGVMAQEVAEVVPETVQRGADGYLRVDYARLGLRLQTWDQWAAAH